MGEEKEEMHKARGQLDLSSYQSLSLSTFLHNQRASHVDETRPEPVMTPGQSKC